MTCEEIREELVAYQDGELSEHDRKQVATHLSTCMPCAQEAVSLARVGHMFSRLERVAPSPDFVKNFWRRLEQERQAEPESRFVQWWRELRESVANWHLTPALVGAASVLIFFAALAQRPERSTLTSVSLPSVGKKAQDQSKPTTPPTRTVPAEVVEETELFVDYQMINEMDKFARFEEIAAVDLSTEQPAVEVAEGELPKDILDNAEFFAQYPILQQMERLENFDAVLAAPTQDEEQSQG
jgi:hypothetical protein